MPCVSNNNVRPAHAMDSYSFEFFQKYQKISNFTLVLILIYSMIKFIDIVCKTKCFMTHGGTTAQGNWRTSSTREESRRGVLSASETPAHAGVESTWLVVRS